MTDFDYDGFSKLELLQVASVLAFTNPSHCGNSADALERTCQYIVSHARAEYAKTGDFGYLGTMGWVVSTYSWKLPSGDLETRFKVTLESWGVLKYIESMTTNTKQ